MTEPKFIQVSTIFGLMTIALGNIASYKPSGSGTITLLGKDATGKSVVVEAQQSYSRIHQLVSDLLSRD